MNRGKREIRGGQRFGHEPGFCDAIGSIFTDTVGRERAGPAHRSQIRRRSRKRKRKRINTTPGIASGIFRPEERESQAQNDQDKIHYSGQGKAYGKPMPLGGGVQFDSLLVKTIARESCRTHIATSAGPPSNR